MHGDLRLPKLSPSARAALEEMFESAYRLEQGWHAQTPAAHRAAAWRPEPVSRSDRDAVLRVLEVEGPLDAPPAVILAPRGGPDGMRSAIGEFARHPDVALGHVLRLWALHGQRLESTEIVGYLLHSHLERHGPYRLTEIADAYALAGGSRDGLAMVDLYGGYGHRVFEWVEGTADYYVERLPLLEQHLRTPSTAQRRWFRPSPTQTRTHILEVLAEIPTARWPASLVDAVWDLAVGSAKQLRPIAQAALDPLDGIEARIVDALGDRTQETRANAARWLGARRNESAVGPLRGRLAKEKKDEVRGAIFDALEALGVPTHELVSRDALLKDAAKVEKKGVPEALSWFPFDRLPELRFARDGAPAPRALVERWVLKAHKLKTPAANAEMKREVALLVPSDREALGLFVLDAWIEEDTGMPTALPADKVAGLREQAEIYASYGGGSVEKILADLVQRALSQPAGSAIKLKGALALAGACGGSGLAPAVEAYLKKWYGWRAAQCKALVQMLAHVEHPSAIQLLFATASRFRTAGIKKEAEAQVSTLAERKGWTLDELADRTIPTGGFDDAGELTFEYGATVEVPGGEPRFEVTRTFTARIRDDLSVVVLRPDGELGATLPDPRKGEDEAIAKAAKKALQAAKKKVTATAKREAARLYEAMCSERGIPFDDWDRYLHRHPIVKHLVPALVFGAYEGETLVTTFRPLGDGSLTTIDDEGVRPPDDALVRVAHALTLGDALGARWLAHLDDYAIVPLFAQVGRPIHRLADDMRGRDRITDFEGHLVSAFTLRNTAKKLGYERGPAEDGGWFHVYRKTMLGLGIDVVIEHSGSPLPEEDKTLALLSLSFERRAAEGEPSSGHASLRLALRDVPRVLFSETIADVRALCDAGLGYAADWERHVGR